VIYPIPEIAARCHAAGALLHTDAVQALGNYRVALGNCRHGFGERSTKSGGLKAWARLVLKGNPGLFPTHFGGSQETKRRGGTETLPESLVLPLLAKPKIPSAETLAQVETLRDRMERLLVQQDSEIEIIAEGVVRA
jgi:cysteine desulfurase